MSRTYDEILELPHHVSAKRQQMSHRDRAAQFAPFAALTGYDAVIKETARLTGQQVELTETAKAALNETLQWLAANLHRLPEASVTYFQPDLYKSGGEYIRVTGIVRKIDGIAKLLIMDNGTAVCFEDIRQIDCAVTGTTL